MSDQKQFELFKQAAVTHMEEHYGQEARELYGNARVDHARNEVMALNMEQYLEWANLKDKIQSRLEEAVKNGEKPESEVGKEITNMHRQWITLGGNLYSPDKHKSTSELYVIDQRFKNYYDKNVSGCAQFLRDAIHYWASLAPEWY